MAGPVPPTTSRLIVKRGGSAITGKVPKPVVIIDSREQKPFSFARFKNWIADEQVGTLQTGDYSVVGMEHLICLERKSLGDLLSTLMHQRDRFWRECERMTKFKYRAILVEADYLTLKSNYTGEYSQAHPNGVVGTLDALEAKYQIPVILTSVNKDLAEERAASWISKNFTYEWLESNNLGRVLQEGDL
jgi:ERCC4-type nuclease